MMSDMKSLNKGKKTKILEHWFGIDQVLFGKSAKTILEGEELKKYYSTKAALLSNLFEMYGIIGYTPKNNSYGSIANLIEAATKIATKSFKRSSDLLNEDSIALKSIKKEIKNTGLSEGLENNEVTKYVVLKRNSAVALDSMMLESVLNKSRKDNLKEWNGKVMLDSHKVLRDTLIEISLQH